MDSGPLRVSAVICAYNEERNLGGLLDALLAAGAPWFELAEVVVVASGCTDSTVELLAGRARKEPRLKLLVEPRRRGKAAALTVAFEAARSPILLVENADTIPAPGAIEALLSPLREPNVALVSCHPVPVNPGASRTARVGEVLWEVHDRLSRITPKVGEAFALRRERAVLPPDVEDDETYLGAYATLAGGEARYADGAIIFNRVPTHPRELLHQRRRIDLIVVRLARRTGILSSAWSPALLLRALASYAWEHPERWVDCLLLAGLESLCRLGALFDLAPLRPRLGAWPEARSTKDSIPVGGRTALERRELIPDR